MSTIGTLVSGALTVAVLAVPGLVSAQGFDGELYGQFRYSYNRADDGTAVRWASANNASRLGVRGSVSGDDLTAFLHVEVAVSVDGDPSGQAFDQRFAYGGVRGAFGSVTVGRHTTAYKAPAVRLDPFYDTSTPSAGGSVPDTGPFAGASYGLSPLSNGWSDRALAYRSPALAGVRLDAGVYLEPDADHDYGLGVTYRREGLDVGVRYYDAESDENWAQARRVDDALRLHARYWGSDRWSAGVSFERLAPRAGETQPYLYVSGTVEAIEDVTVAGSVGYVGSGDVQATTGTGGNLGLFWEPHAGTRIYGLVSRIDCDHEADVGTLSLGLTQGFEIGG